MRIFSREQALAAGFDPAMYSQYPPEGEMIGQLDFAMTGTLFFRQVVPDIRYDVFLTDEDGSLSPFERMKFFRYTHDGDICRMEIKPNAFGNSSLQSIEIVKQAPVCARSGSCPHSQCCVSKS